MEKTSQGVRSYKLSDDVAASFGAWCELTHTPKGDAAQLGLWLVAHLQPDQRQAFMESMDRREQISVVATAADPTDPQTDPIRRTKDVPETPERARSHGKRAGVE